MSPADYVLIAVLAVCVVFALRSMFKKKGNCGCGCSSCCDCSHCSKKQ